VWRALAADGRNMSKSFKKNNKVYKYLSSVIEVIPGEFWILLGGLGGNVGLYLWTDDHPESP
jgi:hypothetical protein